MDACLILSRMGRTFVTPQWPRRGRVSALKDERFPGLSFLPWAPLDVDTKYKAYTCVGRSVSRPPARVSGIDTRRMRIRNLQGGHFKSTSLPLPSPLALCAKHENLRYALHDSSGWAAQGPNRPNGPDRPNEPNAPDAPDGPDGPNGPDGHDVLNAPHGLKA